jgi:hypothetical protein
MQAYIRLEVNNGFLLSVNHVNNPGLVIYLPKPFLVSLNKHTTLYK